MSSRDDLVVVRRSTLERLADARSAAAAAAREQIFKILASTGLLAVARYSGELVAFAKNPRATIIGFLAQGGDAIAQFVNDPFEFVQLAVLTPLWQFGIGLLVDGVNLLVAGGQTLGDWLVAGASLFLSPFAFIVSGILGWVATFNATLAAEAEAFGIAAFPVLGVLTMLEALAALWALSLLWEVVKVADPTGVTTDAESLLGRLLAPFSRLARVVFG